MSAKENTEKLRRETTGAARAEQETRCYTLTGTARELDEAERILQQLEPLGAEQGPRLLFFALDGQQRGVTLRTLATWIEE